MTEVQEKITKWVQLLQDDGVFPKEKSLKELYNEYLHPNILPLQDKDTWNTIQQASSLDLFQLDSDIGRQGAKKVKPTNMQELSSVNALIRLMTAEKGAETPMEKYIRFRKNPQDWESEMNNYHLTEKEKKAIKKYISSTYGIGISQEQLMRSLMDPDICNFTLAESNAARKTVAKKRVDKIKDLRQKVWEKAGTENMAEYIWMSVVAPGLGYSFSDIHSMAYSYIGFQTAYIATHWNPLYWNTACLIVNSGSLEMVEDKDAKDKTTDYTKVAKALGSIISKNIQVSLVDINKSDYSFKPDIENNTILFGLKGLNRVGDNVIKEIIEHRPYKGIKDFMQRCPQNKMVMISLIKAGAFDEIDKEWAQEIFKTDCRIGIMAYYIYTISEPKKRLTLQNFNQLLQSNLVPEDLLLQKRTFLFNNFLKTYKKYKDCYVLDGKALEFYTLYFDTDQLITEENNVFIKQTVWTKIYKSTMDKARDWLKENQQELLDKINELSFKTYWDNYASGNISAWEMESMCFYYHEHELASVNNEKYGIVDFKELPSIPVVDYFFKRGRSNIPIYKIQRIVGTVIAKDDTRSSVTLLTTSGVVAVKFTKEYFAMFNRQISEIQPDGTKKVKEKSWFKRGVKLMVSGFRRDDTFVAKTYKNTIGHQLYKIDAVEPNGEIILVHERYGENNG